MALTQITNGMIADGAVSAAKLAGDVTLSPVTIKLITDSTLINLNDVASSYNNVGSSFSAVIPASGFIRVSASCRLQNDFSGAANIALVLGIRIGTTNYWFGDYLATGVLTRRGYIIYSASVLNDYVENYGSGAFAGNGLSQDMNILAKSIPTGTQTIQLIAARGTGTTATSLRGATTTTRVVLEFVSAA